MFVSPEGYIAPADIASAVAGNITVEAAGNEYKLTHFGVNGLPTTVHIPKDKILYAKAIPASAMTYTSKATFVSLDSDINSGAPITGQDYLLNIRINGLYWDSDEVWGHKYGVVHATSGMTASAFYVKMALSLAKNLSRDAAPMLKVYVIDGSNHAVEVTANTDESSLSGTYTGIIIDEVEQPWKLGTMPQHPVEYTVSCGEITVSGTEVTWGEVSEKQGSLTVVNSKKIADMEYFYHGERGDMYREAAWPNNWPNVGLADPSAASGYDVVEIHWYWDGANHAVQKSEKDVTIAFSASNGAAAFVNAWNGLSITDSTNSIDDSMFD